MSDIMNLYIEPYTSPFNQNLSGLTVASYDAKKKYSTAQYQLYTRV